MATFSKQGTGIKLVNGSVSLHFEDPVISAYTTKSGDNRANLIEVIEGSKFALLPITDITLVGGITPSGTVHDIADQIMALTL